MGAAVVGRLHINVAVSRDRQKETPMSPLTRIGVAIDTDLLFECDQLIDQRG